MSLPPALLPTLTLRSKALAHQVGAYHLDITIDTLVSCVVSLFNTITGKTPRFKADGGTAAENLALQNIQVGRAEGKCAGWLLSTLQNVSGKIIHCLLYVPVRHVHCRGRDHTANQSVVGSIVGGGADGFNMVCLIMITTTSASLLHMIQRHSSAAFWCLVLPALTPRPVCAW